MTTNKKIVQRVFLMMIVITMIISFNIYISYADYIPSPEGALGACAIENPTYNGASSLSSYHYVYMGNTTPTLFRVLYTKANDGPFNDTKNGTPALFLLSEYAPNTYKWDSRSSGYGQDWTNDNSIRKTYLRTTVYNYFDTTEQSAILSTTSHESGNVLAWYKSSSTTYYAGPSNSSRQKTNQLSGDTIFLLSAEEVINEAYGFANKYTTPSGNDPDYYYYPASDTRICYKTESASSASVWWLRSAFSSSDNRVALVNSSGGSSGGTSGYSYDVRFALNVHLSSIITSEASTSASGASCITFKAIGDTGDTTVSPRLYLPKVATSKPPTAIPATPASANAYKLTIADGGVGEHFKITSVTKSGSSLYIGYSDHDEDNNICAVLKKLNADGTSNNAGPHYFARKTGVSATSGTVEFTLPSDINLSGYKIIAYSEKFNEGQKTNIAKYDIYNGTISCAAGALGACNIVNPSGTSYQYVYFGNSSSRPIQFRVLSTTANGTLRETVGGSTCSNAALFMMSEYGLCNHTWDSRSSGYGQEWKSGYSIREWLNSESSGPLKDCFTAAERDAIAYTTTSEAGRGLPWHYKGTSSGNYCYNNSGKYWYVAGRYNSDMSKSVSQLSNDKLFLLSAEEVTNAAYGFNFTKNYPDTSTSKYYAYKFAGNDICKLGISSSSVSGWWLRSACSDSDYRVAMVSSSGESIGSSSGNSDAVRFALNVHLSSIIYASNASTTGASASTFKAIDSIDRISSPVSADGYKLTIQNTSRPAFSVSPSSITATPGSKIAVHYTNANTGSNEYICGIIKKSDNSECYHGRFAPNGSNTTNITSSYASGYIIMDLPSLTTGTYKLIMYNETNDGTAYKTNEGRCANEITLTITIQSSLSAGSGPTISNVYKKGDGSYYRLTATDSNGILMATSSDGNSVFRAIGGPSGTYNIPTSSGTTEFRVYNFAGNYSLVNETNNTIMTDSMAPVINSVRYSEGKYIIDVTDSDSGIWKITDSQGNIIADYSTI